MRKIILIAIFMMNLILIVSCAEKIPPSPAQIYKNNTSQQLLAKGESAMDRGDYKQAVKYFEALDTLYPFGPVAQQGQIDSIYAYYKNDDVASALAAADRYIRLYPRSEHADYAYYMRGRINLGRGYNWMQRTFRVRRSERDLTYAKAAYIDFQNLIELYPNSYYAPDAHRRMIYIRNLVAQHELEVAEFYFVREAFVGAANRAMEVVEHYQGTPQVIPALAIMVKSYLALGEDQLANDALQVLLMNYPHSKEARLLSQGHYHFRD